MDELKIIYVLEAIFALEQRLIRHPDIQLTSKALGYFNSFVEIKKEPTSSANEEGH